MPGFWMSQPVGDRKKEEVNKQFLEVQTSLPEGYAWCFCLNTSEIAEFIRKNYVEDSQSRFRLIYPKEFFDYLFSNPKHEKWCSLGIMNNNMLVGYVLAQKERLSICENIIDVSTINFLCIDKKHRKKYIAPILITEIKRLSNLNGIMVGMFTGKENLGFGFMKTGYYHFLIDELSLYNKTFIESLYGNYQEKKYIRRLDTHIATEKDIEIIYKLYNEKYKNYKIYRYYKSLEEIHHSLKTIKDIQYLLYNSFSREYAFFYILNTYVVEKNTYIKTGYLSHWCGTNAIIYDTIEFLRSIEVELLNVLNVGDNMNPIKEFKMFEGSGVMYYYLFNYQIDKTEPSEINCILY